MAIATIIPDPVSTPLQQTFACREQIPLHPEILWKIERGVVKATTWNEEGSFINLGFWGPGDVVGHALSRVNPYHLECLTPVEVSAFTPGLWHHLVDAMLRHGQQSEELLSIVQCGRVNLRLMKLLDWLSQKFGRKVPQGQLIELRLTHQEIAEVINTTRVTITRLLRELEQDRKLIRSQGQLILL